MKPTTKQYIDNKLKPIVKGYVDDKLFITSENVGLVKYSLETEIKENFATKASYHIHGLIYGDYEYVNGEWNCIDRK